MDGETKILFTDTNEFIQVRDLKDIPWRDIFPSVKTVDVMVAPSVIDELDLALVIRENPIRVRIVISTAPRLNWTEHPNLDPANPDDQLVGAALSVGSGAAVISHDTGPRWIFQRSRIT